MNLRFAALITGCMFAGAAAAAYHRAEVRPFARASLAAAELPVPLFMQAATGAPTTAAWPPSASIAFYDEMFALLHTGPTPQTQPPQTPPPPRVATVGTGGAQAPQGAGGAPTPPAVGGAPTPPGAGVTPPPAGNDTVEIVIRDRFGRPIRVERVDRRLLAGGGYPQPPRQPYYGPQPYGGPYGPYGPYRPYR